MKPRAGQNQIRSPCPRAPARPHVRLSDTTRTGRAAEDVGPYHPSCPERARRAKDPRRPRRGTPPSFFLNNLRSVNTERAEARGHGGGWGEDVVPIAQLILIPQMRE